MEDFNLFKNDLKELNIDLNEKQFEQFLRYYNLLIERNKVMNLTAITDFNEVIKKHFVDSLSIIKVMDLTKSYSIIDLGTGAGFPGIPLKIAFPNLNITLLDSLNKRIKFLNDVIDELNLNNINAIHGRAEDFGRDKNYREYYDICVSRAVANLSTLSEYCMPYVKKGGFFVSYKSGNLSEELENSKNAVKALGGEIVKSEMFNLPNSDIERSLIVIEKKLITPKIYPRSAGKPSKEPII